MAKINGLDVEKVAVINKVGMKYEKAVMGMDRAALDLFENLMGLNMKFNNGRETTKHDSIIAPNGFKPAWE
jgi:hypothetical protein